jgi:hypothetical protein
MTFSWRTDPAVVELLYTYDPECDLRILDLDAPASALRGYVNSIVNGPGWVSTYEAHQFAKCLEASDSRSILLGLRAAALLGKGDAYRDFYEPVAKLRAHADARIAEEAKRVERVLFAEAGGNPKPPGLRGLAITWRETSSAEFPYETERNGCRIRIRIGDFPAEPMYTVIAEVEGREANMGSFDEWPADWTRPGKKAAAKPTFVVPDRPEGVSFAYESGMEHSPTCQFGRTSLVLAENGVLRLVMLRAGRTTAWEGVLIPQGCVKLLDALRTAGFPVTPKPKGPPGVFAADSSLDTLTVNDAHGNGASITIDANAMRFDARYAAVWTILDCLKRQVSGGKVGYVADTIGPAVEGSTQVT